jgi:hypothetical protein
MCAPEIGKYILFGTPSQKPQQPSRDDLEKDSLAKDQSDGDHPIKHDVALFQAIQALGDEAQNKKKISDYQHGIDDHLQAERPKCLARFFFHFGRPLLVAAHLSAGCMPSRQRANCIAPLGFGSKFHSPS